MAYATLAQLREYINVTSTSEDTLLQNLVTRAGQMVDTYTGASFEATTATRYYNASEDVDGNTLLLDDDLLTVTTLTNGDSSTIASTDYVLLPPNKSPKYAIRLLGSKGIAWIWASDPENAISVAGAWGHSMVAPYDIVMATLRIAAWMYRQRDAQVYDTVSVPDRGEIVIPQGLPRDAERILRAYRRWM